MPREENSGEIQEVRSERNKIVDFPVSQNSRLDAAIKLYESGADPAAALKEFITLIDEGCDEGYFFAGCIYEEGGQDVAQDLGKALFYYQKSVGEFGYVEGYLALGRLHYHGIGVTIDYAKAFDYYSTVAKHEESPIAEIMLGLLYQHGRGVDKNLDKAREYYNKAATRGYIYAIKNLALLEEELGHRLKGLLLRLKAGFTAFNIARREPRDARLRGGKLSYALRHYHSLTTTVPFPLRYLRHVCHDPVRSVAQIWHTSKAVRR